MRAISESTLGGLTLIVGPLLAIVFFILQPGGVLINSAEMDEAYATIYALSRYRTLANLTVIAISLGLIVSLYGQFVLLSGMQARAGGAALAWFGFIFLAFGGFGWFVVQALNFGMADTQLEVAASVQSAVAVYTAETSIALLASLAIAFGFLLFSLGLAGCGACNRVGAWIVAAVSLIALLSLIIGISDPSRLSDMIQVSRLCYFVWAIWTVSLGVGLLRRKEPPPATTGN
ncbi:MAG: hypothetical protein OXM03_11475 [Chloroflexota bacterium]|nr:hypothetical protein [Chloroflexota bacterium]MDE2841236.1 hypothetical protein [Chloroflexota bacterium]MDE2930426.1 hypothetical protein [Chloroflexota bacterium]